MDVLFIPGLKSQPTDYETLLTPIEEKGYRVKPVSIEWANTTAHDWTRQVLDECVHHEEETTILAGFSLGAWLASVISPIWRPEELWLLSLSARFAEDLDSLPEERLQHFSAEQRAAFHRSRWRVVGQHIDSRTKLFVGSEEFPELIARVKEAHRDLPESTLTVAEGAGHDPTATPYLDAVLKSI